jgi:hypothetical protein
LRAGLPDRHLPPSGFLTLSTVSPHPGLVALFHATSAPGILAFRAFPTRSAVAPLGALGSLAVRLAPPLARERPGSPQLDRASTSSKAGPTPLPCNPEGAPTTSAASRRKQATNTMRRAVATSSEAYCTTPTKAALGSVKALSKLARAGVNPDSRALLRPSVRSPLRAVRPQKKPMLSWPSPLRGFPDWPLGFRPPLPRFSRGQGCLPKKAPFAVRRHLRVSIRTSPGDDSEESSQPP